MTGGRRERWEHTKGCVTLLSPPLRAWLRPESRTHSQFATGRDSGPALRVRASSSGHLAWPCFPPTPTLAALVVLLLVLAQ